jgi:hypothetical protein
VVIFERKNMKQHPLTCIVVTMIIVIIGSFVPLLAGSETKNDYTLTVSAGTPASTPDPAAVYHGWNAWYSNKSSSDVTASFSASIKKKTARGAEDVSGDVKESYYTVSVSGTESFLYACQPWKGSFLTWPTEYSTDKQKDKFDKAVNPVVRSKAAGEKTVTLSVRVIMKDGTELSASETIKFTVQALGIVVYAYVGNLLTPPTEDDDFYYGVVNNITLTGIGFGSSVFGHASFKIHGEVPPADSYPWYDTNYVNTTCGYSVIAGHIPSFLTALWDYPQSHNTPVGNGKLIIDDSTGGTSKDFGILDTDAENAVSQAKSLHKKPPRYQLHRYNCVDACLSVIRAAGLNLGNCRYDVILENTKSKYKHKEKMSLPDELEKKLL